MPGPGASPCVGGTCRRRRAGQAVESEQQQEQQGGRTEQRQEQATTCASVDEVWRDSDDDAEGGWALE